jgi:DNA-binding response OmpR family regulator
MAEEKTKAKILLVEDERMLADMYATKFSMEGFETVNAYDGKEGLAAAAREKPALILLDIIMPKLDGFAVLQQLKENEETKKIPVILLTNLGQESDVAKGKKLGADGYFVKANHSPQEVVDMVKEKLKKK